MPKIKKKATIAVDELQTAVAKFTRQTDRGTAIIATAWVDSALEAALVAFFPEEEELMEDLLKPEGPLGSLAVRTKIAYLLQIIPPSLAHDLDIIRRIRNDFAHLHEELRFTDQRVRDRCTNLVAAQAYAEGWGTLRSNRQKFIISCYFATEWLLASRDQSKGKKRPPLLDLYGTTIHRRAKHASLEVLKAFIEKEESKQ